MGTCLAAHLGVLPGGACACLAALGFALRRPAGLAIAFAALGLLNAEVRWIEPHERLLGLELRRPLDLVAGVTGHPVRDGEETLVRVRTRYLRPGRDLLRIRLDVLLTLPERAVAPDLGTTVRVRGYLRRSPGFANTPRERPGPWRMRVKSGRFIEVVGPPGPVPAMASRLRGEVEAALEEVRRLVGRTPRSEGLIRALVLGDRSSLPTTLRQVVSRLGLAHMLAVSGLHVGVVGLLVYLLGQPLPRSARYLVTLAAVFLYLAVIGPRPAVLRASIMGLLALSSLLAHRPPQSLNALAWSTLALVGETPSVVGELGFQLSFAATASIVLVSPLYARVWCILPKWPRYSLAASLAAQLATAPFLLPTTGSIHPLAAAFNLAAIPWLCVFLLCVLPWLGLAWVWAPAAAALVEVPDALASILLAVQRWPPTPLDLRLCFVPPAAAWGWCLVGAALAGRIRRSGAALLLLLALSLEAGTAQAPVPAELVVLDVGQGDALLLRDGRRALLVDGGGWPRGDLGGRVLLPALAAAGVSRLDAVLMTHPDLDHCGGLADLVRYLPVTEVWTGPGVAAAPETCAARLLGAPGPRRRVVQRGDVMALGRWTLEVLHPDPRRELRETNDRSVVLLARFGGLKALLAGDIEKAAEEELLGRPAELRAEVLKVAHHGSKSSTSTAWLRAVAPRFAIISAGPNNLYGHPAEPVLARLRQAGARILRTDLSGRIRLEFHADGRLRIGEIGAPGW